MARKRKKKLRIDSAKQLKLLNSPTAFELIQLLRHRGEATTTELGLSLGKKPNSLHYHMRKLVEAGFVHQIGTQRSGARTEVIYDVVADQFVGANSPLSATLRKLTVDAVATLARLAVRNFSAAAERRADLVDDGKHRNMLANRYAARLTPAQFAQANHHLKAIEKLFIENIGSTAGQNCALTVILTPIEPPSQKT